MKDVPIAAKAILCRREVDGGDDVGGGSIGGSLRVFFQAFTPSDLNNPITPDVITRFSLLILFPLNQ